MKKLDHPNVVKLYEVLDVREDDSLFMGIRIPARDVRLPADTAHFAILVVELCADGPLMSLSMGEEKEPLDEETSRNYFRQMILAIEYLHCNGIVCGLLFNCWPRGSDLAFADTPRHQA